jgi:predicted regulator of Ras-like GTPase activity (Roadblock/LC7/MglB family)
MSEARDGAVKEVLTDLEAAYPGSVAALVLRNGALFAGRAPAAVNREVYAAMVAAMAGASETATADLGDEVQSVEARLKQGALFCAPVGRKLVLVLYAPGPSASKGAAGVVSAASRVAPLF